jgi:hypothetical protein
MMGLFMKRFIIAYEYDCGNERSQVKVNPQGKIVDNVNYFDGPLTEFGK